MEKHGWKAVLAVAFVSASLTGCTTKSTQQDAEARFDRYADALVKRDKDAVWKLMSPRLKEGSDSDPDNYWQFFEDQDVYFLRFERVKTEVTGERGEVTVNFLVSDSLGKSKTEDLQRCGLILHKGLWYVDGCKPVAAAS